MNKRIIIILGRICSGKDTFAANLINHIQIDIGSIVRQITRQETRIHNKDLDSQIINELSEILDRAYNKYIITGIRQLSILEHLIKYTRIDNLELIYLDVPDEELKRRFINRKDSKDKGLTFEEVIEKDHELGLGEIEKFIEENKKLFTIIKNY